MSQFESLPEAILVLEDGRVFEGRGFGADVNTSAELVFNTSMSGYQEILTDPSYAGQLVTLTTAQVGNYGVNPQDMESEKIHALGLVIRALSTRTSNWRASQTLEQWLTEHQVPAICDVDTRALTRHIRDLGVMRAMIVRRAHDSDVSDVVETLKSSGDYGAVDFVAQVQVRQPHHVVLDAAGEAQLMPGAHAEGGASPHIVVMDFGTKRSILRHLAARGLAVTLVPGDLSAQEVMALKPDGVLLSNGPGDPAQMDRVLEPVRALIELKPVFGICLGHQLLARALGASTFKLRFGHRGPNQPVKSLDQGVVAMTSQNHGYAVDADSMPEQAQVTHINLNDGTVAGFRHRDLPVFAVQYHPEAGPGPHDAEPFFDEFFGVVSSGRQG